MLYDNVFDTILIKTECACFADNLLLFVKSLPEAYLCLVLFTPCNVAAESDHQISHV